MTYQSNRVRVDIYYDRLISTVEAKDTAVNLICNDMNLRYGKLNRLHNKLPKNPLLLSVKDIKRLERKQDKILKMLEVL